MFRLHRGHLNGSITLHAWSRKSCKRNKRGRWRERTPLGGQRLSSLERGHNMDGSLLRARLNLRRPRDFSRVKFYADSTQALGRLCVQKGHNYTRVKDHIVHVRVHSIMNIKVLPTHPFTHTFTKSVKVFRVLKLGTNDTEEEEEEERRSDLTRY